MKKQKKKMYVMKGKVLRYAASPASWHFAYVERKLSEEIRKVKTKKVGFSFVPIEATVGKTTWRTTLFPTKEKLYLLALKADVRKQEDIGEGDTVKATFVLL